MSFEKFKQDFEQEFGKDLYEFIDRTEILELQIPFNGKLVQNLDQEAYNSYGYEDSKLRRVFFFEDHGIHVEFYGFRQSYHGEEWEGFREVKQTQKTITVWE